MHLDRESGGDRGRGDTHQSMGKSMGRHIEFPAVYPPPRVLVTSANNYSVIHRGDIVINKLFDWLISWPRLFAYPLPPPVYSSGDFRSFKLVSKKNVSLLFNFILSRIRSEFLFSNAIFIRPKYQRSRRMH